MKIYFWQPSSAMFLLLLSPLASAIDATRPDDEYVFDNSLIRGNDLNTETLSRFNSPNSFAAGEYDVDVYVNTQYVDRMKIAFTDHNKKTQSCLTKEQLLRSGVKSEALKDVQPQSGCVFVAGVLPGSNSHFDLSHLRLDLSIPQSLVTTLPRGYVAPENLDIGNAIGFLNYNANQYHVQTSTATKTHLDSTYLGMEGGINIGLWRFRQQGSWHREDYSSHWDRNRTYIQRALPAMRSEMTLGETYTGGQLFSSLSYRGIAISTDDRMLPDSMRGYAPTVRGVARTNARVAVYQNNRSIYQSTVPPGAFEIDDLSATNYGGDLTVVVTEADGSQSTFQVPFASVPESLRPGLSRYNFSLGKVRDTGDQDVFGELTYQRGISNRITGNTGLRVADGYQSAIAGGVFTDYIGAFGLDMVYSRASLPNGEHQSGWMTHASFSHTFQATNTTLALAGYRYSTAGYRELSDVLAVRKSGTSWLSSSYLQRSRYEVSLNQSLHTFGSVFASGSSQDYRDGRSRDTQLQFGYSTMLWHDVSVSLTVARQRTTHYDRSQHSDWDAEDANLWSPHSAGNSLTAKETISQLSVSFPLGSNQNAPFISSSVSHSNNNGYDYQTSLSGTTGDDHSMSYSANITRQDLTNENTFGGSLQKRLPRASLNISASKGHNYLQASGSARGSVAVHRGGVTFGPYLSDTFGLVEAKGATGAKVMNGQGATIDSFGYALVPTLMPYRYNTISLDPENMPAYTELQDGERRIAPYAGSTVKIKFRTLTGYPVLLQTTLSDGSAIPMGADLYDDKGRNVGMMGLGGLAWFRAESTTGKLTIKWGDDRYCSLNYDLGKPDKDQSIVKASARCLAN